MKRSRMSNLKDWLVTVGELGVGESVYFNLEHLTMDDVRAALKAQYPDRRDLVTSNHGSRAYVGVASDHLNERVWDRLTGG